MTLQNMPQTVLVAPAGEEQSFADAGSQGSTPLVTETPAPSQTPSGVAAQTPDAVPPPSTTVAPGGPDTPAGD
jgi:hypothetical protein